MKNTINIFGPCSAESEKQLLETAAGLSGLKTDFIFRAGLWKPRTRPDSFEGVGENGISWMQAVKQKFGYKLATEVATPQHVEVCLKAGIDSLWVGARTTVSPFVVQDLANALKGVDIPIFIKNPIHADISLWLGAIERMEKAVNSNVAAIHRGFFNHNSKPYRNAPNWDIPIQLKTLRPDISIICDASHIAGKKSLISLVAQKSIDLDLDGLMIESHNEPTNALSDSKQQITPSKLIALVNSLTEKKASIDNPDFDNRLENLRYEIDNIDDKLLEQLAKRMEIAKKIGEDKRLNKVTILQLERWKAVLEKSFIQGKALGLNSQFIGDMLNLIHEESIRQQTNED